MWPLVGHGLRDGLIAGQRVNGGVEGDVRIDQARDGRPRPQLAARNQRRLRSLALGFIHLTALDALRGKARGNAVQSLAHKIEIADAPAVDRRHLQTALAMLDEDRAASAPAGHGSRLARDTEHGGDALLCEAWPEARVPSAMAASSRSCTWSIRAG